MAARRRIRSARGRDRLAAVLRESSGLITPEDAAQALDISRRDAAMILARWTRQGWLKRLRRGLYVPIPIDALSAEGTLRNPWVLVPELFNPGYVGGWSAAAHWDLTEQIFRDVCVFTAKPFRRKRETIEGIAFFLNRVQEEAIFGTAVVWEGTTRIPISDLHKTLIDMLARPSTGGGIHHIADCLTAYLRSTEHDLDKLLTYGDRLGNGAVFKRLGFLLSRAITPPVSTIQACRDRLTTGNTKLDPALDCPNLVTEWKLRVPKRWKQEAIRD